MESWKNARKEMPKDGDFILIHKFCELFAGWFCDKMDGVSYEEYLKTFEPDDEDDEPMSRDDYDYRRYSVSGVYCNGKHAYWEDVKEWMPIPEV